MAGLRGGVLFALVAGARGLSAGQLEPGADFGAAPPPGADLGAAPPAAGPDESTILELLGILRNAPGAVAYLRNALKRELLSDTALRDMLARVKAAGGDLMQNPVWSSLFGGEGADGQPVDALGLEPPGADADVPLRLAQGGVESPGAEPDGVGGLQAARPGGGAEEDADAPEGGARAPFAAPLGMRQDQVLLRALRNLQPG